MAVMSVIRSLIAVAALTTTLAGCAGGATPTPTETEALAPSAAPTIDPRDPAVVFRLIADASCDEANEQGVVETTADGSASSILVPRSEAYEDFTAVAHTAEDGASLIWSTEDFLACNASVGFAMSEESGTDYPLDITFNEADGTYSTVFDGGEDFIIETTYEVANDKFVRATLGGDAEPVVMNIAYGMPTAEQIEILHLAVDEFLAD